MTLLFVCDDERHVFDNRMYIALFFERTAAEWY